MRSRLPVARTVEGCSCRRSPTRVCYRHAMVSLVSKGGVPHDEKPVHAAAPAPHLASEQSLPLIGATLPHRASQEGRPLHTAHSNLPLMFFSLR